MPLDAKGKIAIATIPFVAPIMFLALAMVIKHKTRHHNIVWPPLIAYGAMRITGAVLLIQDELHGGTVALKFAAYASITTALAPLMVVNSGIILATAQHSPIANHTSIRLDAILIKLCVISSALNSIGGGILGLQTSRHVMTFIGGNLRNAGAVFYLVALVRVLLNYTYLFLHRHELTARRRKFLLIALCSTPFLLARTVYTNITGFVPSRSVLTAQNGNFRYYLVLVLVLEYIMIGIYFAAAFIAKIELDWDEYHEGDEVLDDVESMKSSLKSNKTRPPLSGRDSAFALRSHPTDTKLEPLRPPAIFVNPS